ncbi:putative toxin-antitoxin system toxin component, PIN family [Pseudanabaena sp. ABRG5-3]|uniref:putative toxin-antitoxin system toxin component, PIN family n=1 Tax=Pseudanabaena sp. ABRG5-3 TaxID=685565 RepID=UPI0021F1D820|nr:putative toxin-antitoxin system toxin component, PIN family [Pseudanabaena sp. ABRG5-3]
MMKMKDKNLRVVLDTNVLISSLLLKNSPPFRVVELIFSRSILLRSESTLSELQEVLGRKKFNKYLTLEERQVFLSKFLARSELVEIRQEINVCRDPKDNKFLELAVNGNASLIITGDDDLLVLNPFRDIQIFTPQDFLIYFDS